LRIGATFLLTAAILSALWLVFALLSGGFYSLVDRKWKDAGAPK
jgi:hypothetical protein